MSFFNYLYSNQLNNPKLLKSKKPSLNEAAFLNISASAFSGSESFLRYKKIVLLRLKAIKDKSSVTNQK
ncbi:hypothetical protein DCO46_20700 [Flavobacterium sp. HTF]|nr:hypothetical protein DCO46_20700 [Flavobacterium sp. HTF]